MQGMFISFEGIEGVGKTTHIHTVAQYLTQRGVDFITTREPGGTPVAEQLRHILLHAQEPLSGETELLLLYAGRLQHVTQVIQPALAKGQWVLCDRFFDATFAYQGGGRQISIPRIEALHQWVLGDFKPDKTLWLDAPVDISMQRLQDRSKDRIEQEQHAFFERVRAVYTARAAQEPTRFYRIDAAPALPIVTAAILDWCEKCL